ncbi:MULTISPECIES: carbohydrate ABC transporter permease [unclassified Rathayibacter]|uniref:carbohydrate ABC transporter permease n=1 Tax=unclassified Rathayibacter TaxID=2609250 RepID=UPI001FB44D90|nr:MULTISPECIES: carbohydrate ABC transporter permease [unclassified Rathayibacter]MCJ1673400.1 carbohydrate ABC transporter permease [Rathayibacter sp. VKM Ac-2929]MCJ1682852.1 carbohydrate ABC transporter permease [Rathayibacter sp. VKM Ac-2928]
MTPAPDTRGIAVADARAGGSAPLPPRRRRRTVPKRPLDRVIDAVAGLLIAIVVFAVLYPLWFIVVASFSDPGAVSSGRLTLIPEGFRLSGYERLLQDERIWNGYRNSVVYAVLGTALNLLVTIPAAFALSRPEFRPRRVLLLVFAVTLFFSGGLIPNYLLYRDLGLLNSMWVFVLPGALSVFNLIIARSFFETSIPEELHDAARIDGVTYLGFFLRIVLPLSAAIIAVIGLYYFVGHWNDYFTGLVFVRDASLLPLQNVLQSILLANQSVAGQGGSGGQSAQQLQETADQIKYGVIIVSTLPLLVLYPFLQRYFDKGVLVGAVKG